MERREEPEVPVKLTEERIRMEWERGANPRTLDRTPLLLESAPLLTERPPSAAALDGDQTPMETELSRGAAPPANAPDEHAVMPDVQIRRPRSRSILHLDDAPAEPAPRLLQAGSILRLDEVPVAPVARPPWTWKLSRRPRRTRGLWTAVLVLSLALAGVVAYSYLAFQRNSVNVSALPGAATIRTVRAEAASAGDEARPALSAAVHRVQQATVEVRGRYEQWRARH